MRWERIFDRTRRLQIGAERTFLRKMGNSQILSAPDSKDEGGFTYKWLNAWAKR